MTKLDQLIEKARILKEQGSRENELSLELRREANLFYGSECRDKDFMEVLQLASAIDEKKWKNNNWEQKIYAVAKGKFPELELYGNFSIGNYAAGIVDLTLDGELKNRICAFTMKIIPENNYSKIMGTRFVEKFKNNKINKKRFKRAIDLNRYLIEEIGSPENSFSVIQEQVYPNLKSILFGNLIGGYEMELHTADQIANFVKTHANEVGGYIGKLIEMPKCIGRVYR